MTLIGPLVNPDFITTAGTKRSAKPMQCIHWRLWILELFIKDRRGPREYLCDLFGHTDLSTGV